MTLYQKLQEAKSEEDVKDTYIKYLGLKGYSKNLIDIQTKEIGIEAKDTSKHSTYAMFTQLMHYVQQAINKGEYVPPFLAVIETKKAAIMKSADVIPFLEKKTIKWGKNAIGGTALVSLFFKALFLILTLKFHTMAEIAGVTAV
jgi:hypothetical protein